MYGDGGFLFIIGSGQRVVPAFPLHVLSIRGCRIRICPLDLLFGHIPVGPGDRRLRIIRNTSAVGCDLGFGKGNIGYRGRIHMNLLLDRIMNLPIIGGKYYIAGKYNVSAFPFFILCDRILIPVHIKISGGLPFGVVHPGISI